MVKRTHQTIWIVFALFIAYLALVRVAITWVQFAPEQFSSTVEWLTESDISFETLHIEQGWFGVEVVAEDVLVELDGFEIEASRVAFDFNLFSHLVPRARWGDALTIQNLAVLEYGAPNDSLEAGMTVERFLSFNAQKLTTNIDLSRFWRKLDIDRFSAAIYEDGVTWRVNVNDLQAFKGERWSLAADFNVHYGQVLQGERFQLKASLKPNLFGGIESGDFTVKAYDAVRLERLVELTPKKWHSILPDGELVPNIKGEISKSLLSRLSVELNALSLKWPTSEAGLPKSVGVNLEWQNQAKIYDGSQTNWQFQLSDVQLDDRFVPTSSPVNVQLVAKRFLHIETDAFDLQPFKPIIKAILHNESVTQLFDASAELTLKNVVADVAVPELYFENLTAEIARLAIPVTDLPGLALQDMKISKEAEKVTVSTDKPVWVMYPIVHSVPMRFDFKSDLTGELDLVTGSWAFNSFQLDWDKMPLTIRANGNLNGKLDVRSQIEPGTVAKVNAYLPYSIMPPALKGWLKSALISGERVRGEFFFKGDLNDFPFDSGDTRFGGVAELESAVLKFNEDWPSIQNLDAKLNWSQFDLSILADTARLTDRVEAKSVDVKVGPLNGHDIAVEFSAKAAAESAVAIDYLLNGPLPSKLGLADMLVDKQEIKLDGLAEVELNRVWIPVAGFEDKEAEVDGSVKFERAELTLFDALNFKEVAGLLRFDQDGVAVKKMTALFQEGQAAFTAHTEKGVININGSGLANVNQSTVVQGVAGWKAAIALPIKPEERGAQAAKTVEVEVEGSKLNWMMPAPLNNQALKGTLLAKMKFDGDDVSLEGRAGELGFFEVYLNSVAGQFELTKGLLSLGVQKANLTHDSGLKVIGHLPAINLDGWVQWQAPEPNGGEGVTEFLKQLEWNDAQVRFDNVELMEHTYTEVDLSWHNAFVRDFIARVYSKEVSANLNIDDQGRVGVNLDWLQLYLPINSLEADAESEEKLTLIEGCKAKPVKTSSWPTIIFNGKNIRIDEIGVPALTFKIEDDSQKLHFKEVEAVLENSAGIVTGDYFFYKQKRLSNANIKLTSKSVKNLTALLGLKKGFTGKRADVSSNIAWQGGLECFNLSELLGKTEYRLTDGAIEAVEPGFARLLGLLNVTSLARRVSLDLKDLTAKGFAYDSIRGDTHFLNGKLHLKNFKLKAPSASVRVKGDINLIKQLFNLKATVVPALGSSLPALSALTGVATPLGALAVYTFMKIIPEINEDLVTYRYSVTGPWDNPVIDGGQKPEEASQNSAFDELLQIN